LRSALKLKSQQISPAPGEVRDPRFLAPRRTPLTELTPLTADLISTKEGLASALSVLPDSWKLRPVAGERFINVEAALDRIKGYGLFCGFAVDCFNPGNRGSSRVQCAHALNTVQRAGSPRGEVNTRSMSCPFTLTIEKFRNENMVFDGYHICEYRAGCILPCWSC
jgi:hypothetical protein